MNPEKIQVLAQLMGALEESIGKLEQYYEERNLEGLNKSKTKVIELQQKISSIIEQNDI